MTGCVRHPQAYPWPRADGVCCAICGGPYTPSSHVEPGIGVATAAVYMPSVVKMAVDAERTRWRDMVNAYLCEVACPVIGCDLACSEHRQSAQGPAEIALENALAEAGDAP